MLLRKYSDYLFELSPHSISQTMDDLPSDSDDMVMEESYSSELLTDRLSELPDSLILSVLSLLPTRDVVRTAIVSKRWKHLWTTVPCLSFSDDAYYFCSFRNFVNQVLPRWKGSKISTFKINFPSYGNYSPSSDVDSWVRFATINEAEELDLNLMGTESVALGENDPGYYAPECLYLCWSIKKLSLLGCNLKIDKENVHWNQLKSLRIDGVGVSEEAINQVLSGAPCLEVLILRIMENFQNLNIQSTSLKKLTIEKCLLVPDEPAMDTMLRIWAPNLEILEFGGIPYIKCLLVNVSSLTDVTVGFYAIIHTDDSDFTWNLLLGKTLRNIFPTIRHVGKLTLSYWCLEVIGVMKKKYLLPSSYEVQFLRVNADYLAVDEIIFLLKIFPKLKILVIEAIDHYLHDISYQAFRETLIAEEDYFLELEESTPKSFRLILRTIEITWPLFDSSIYVFIEFMLKHADGLEKIVIQPKYRNGSVAHEFFFLGAAQKLMALQRSFPSVELILCDADK
ncbi:hypothetical protein OROHE_015099 [Orobanche hederae]